RSNAASAAPRPRPAAVEDDRLLRTAGVPPATGVASASPPASVFAPAKLNLYLHVTGRRADGYHLLDSLVAFADIGDRVTAAPAESLSLAVGGPEAGAIAGLGEDNLAMRAARLFAAEAEARRAGGVRFGAALHLDKRLPAAS